jgi:hypothetical protein
MTASIFFGLNLARYRLESNCLKFCLGLPWIFMLIFLYFVLNAPDAVNAGQSVWDIGFVTAWSLVALVGAFYRRRVRIKFKIERTCNEDDECDCCFIIDMCNCFDYFLDDLCIHWFCPCLALSQEARFVFIPLKIAVLSFSFFSVSFRDKFCFRLTVSMILQAHRSRIWPPSLSSISTPSLVLV